MQPESRYQPEAEVVGTLASGAGNSAPLPYGRGADSADRRSLIRRLIIWAILVSLVVALLIIESLWPGLLPISPLQGDLSASILLGIFLAALACEFVDSSLGMGYGTTLTPLLLLAGFEPLQIVPAVLLSECLTGLAAALLHHRDGNVDLRDPLVRTTACWLGALSVVGSVTAAFVALRIPKFWLTAIIAIIVLSVGVVILATIRRRLAYRRMHILVLGGVAAFNKALSGGGYGPLVTAGQVVSGVGAKQAVAITSLAESLTCLVGLAAYMVLGGALDWTVATPLCLGALLSVPLATLTVRHLPEGLLRGSVGVATCVLGVLMVVKLLA